VEIGNIKVLSPLLDLAGFYQLPFEIETETSVEISAEDENFIVNRGLKPHPQPLSLVRRGEMKHSFIGVRLSYTSRLLRNAILLINTKTKNIQLLS
jgi:hypothetical protein